MEATQATPLGALLLRARKRAELTQEALAERAGVSVNTISNLEAGRGHLPRQATLDLLAEALAGALPPAEREPLRAAFRDAALASRGQRPPAGPPGPAASPASPLPPSLPAGALTFVLCAPAHQPEQAPAPQAALPHLALLLQQVVPRHGGRLVDPPDGPDGAVCVFPRAGDAVAAACALQQALRERAIPVCLALHTGWAEPDGGDYPGPSRRRAARLARLGHPGQILLTQATRELVQGGLPEGVRLAGAGRHSLSAVERPQPIYQLVQALQPISFPPLRALPSPPTNLPVQLTSFVGRERELAALEGLLGQAPLVTLVGAGGAGKTRLALAAAAELVETYREGAFLAELASLTDPGLVPQVVVGALGLREEPGRPILETLACHLKEKRLLLVLDNCEQLLAPCADLASLLLRRCPHLQILATSRERLGITGETSYRVPPLALPAPDERRLLALGECEAVRLFVERARAGVQDFALGAANAEPVALLCRRLGGIPLAIELAAARVGSLPLGEIAARLDSSIGMLSGGPRDVPPRHQTLRATLDWSYDLLGEQERALLARLSVFAGGWVLGAAVALCGGDELGGWPVAALLGGLVSKSLALLQEGGGAGRYALLEPVRQYAAERLAEAGEEATTRDRHFAWYLTLAEEAEPKLKGSEQGTWLARLEAEHDNLRSAMTWSAEGKEASSGLRLAGALWRFWVMHGHLVEGRRWLERALAAEGSAPAPIRAHALLGAGNLAHEHGEMEQAGTYFRQCLALYRQLEDRRGIAAALKGLGMATWSLGDYDQATLLLEEGLALRRELGDDQGVALSLLSLGNVADSRGDLRSARRLYEEALAVFRNLGDSFHLAGCLANLGDLASNQGEYAHAVDLLQKSLDLRRAMGDTQGIAWSLGTLGMVTHALGDAVVAKAHLEASLALFRSLDNLVGLTGVLANLGHLAYFQGDFVQAEILHTESLDIARCMGDKQSIAIALINLGRTLHRLSGDTRALALHREGLALARDIGDSGQLAAGLEGTAVVVASRGQAQRAARFLGAAERLRETLGTVLFPAERDEHADTMQALRQALGEEGFAAAWAAGRALAPDEAVALALAADL